MISTSVYNPTALSVSSLGAYIHWANQIPLLTDEEEKEYARRFHEEQDLEAARKLVLAHLRFVIKVARGYAGYGLQQADLIQEGNIGLMKAVKRFNPAKGVRLVSFAVHWIRAEIHEFIIRNWKIVKIATTKAQRKLFFNLRKLTQNLGSMDAEETKSVAKNLNVSEKDVQMMESRLYAPDQSFESEENEDVNPNTLPANYLTTDVRHNPEHFLVEEDWENKQDFALKNALQTLDARSKDIVRARYLARKKQTLEDLAAKYKISAERVRQIEQVAMKKMRAAMEDQMAA